MSVDLARLYQTGTYTPMLTASSAGVFVNPNLGTDGAATGRWAVTGPLCRFWARFVFAGDNIDRGTGFYNIWLPFKADLNLMDAAGGNNDPNHSIGQGRIRSSTASGSRIVDVFLAHDGGPNDGNRGHLTRLMPLSSPAGEPGTNTLVTHSASAGSWTRIAITGRYLVDPIELDRLAG